MRISENIALTVSSVAFFAFLFLFMTALGMFVYMLLLNILITTFLAAACSLYVFWFLTEIVPVKKHQVLLARSCLFVAIVLQIILLVFTNVEQDLLVFEVVIIWLMKIGFYFFLYYLFLKLSFDFFGAVARRKLVEQKD